ncbi:MAG: transcription-repair coupling factor [Cytophagaceae bacterium]|jgi:transcription-repair coupling factor (superfamily II helicase)|nr:transcription-repair coupling factor [Cytophagaceae bacterium]
MENSSPLVALYRKHPKIAEIETIFAEKNSNLHVKGLSGSALSLIAAALGECAPHFIIAQEKEDAAYLYHDIVQLVGADSVFFLPSSYKRSPEFGKSDNAQAILRTETLRNLRTAQPSQFFVSYPEALMERVPTDKAIENQTLKIAKGEQIDMMFAVDFLKALGFKRADFVYEPGYYSMRGSILDVFSYSYEDPCRIDFFGDEIDSIRSFDIETQLSKETFDEIHVVSNLSNSEDPDAIPITEFIPDSVKIWVNTPSIAVEKMNHVYERVKALTQHDREERDVPALSLFIDGNFIKEALKQRNIAVVGNAQGFKTTATVEFATSAQPLFHKQFTMLEENIRDRQNNGYRVYILSDNERQLERLRQIFADKNTHLEYDELNHALHEGFIDNTLRLCVYTDHQLFDRYHKFSLQTDGGRAARQAISIKELSRLNPGDYMVHVDHGVGRFGGLVTTEINGKKQEAVRLVYRDNDVLLVNIHSLHRISKFKGQDGEPPRVHKLGSGAWQQMKEKTKKKVKDIARELIALYARRKTEPGFAFTPDSYMQKELEASFMYEDTPDQYKATVAVKSDMETGNPMDRLVCGDVGFGKTEIAVRAAFKAVADNKQVAILVPTTILAFQHYHTFAERLKDFPCRVDYISRLRKASDIKITLADVKAGKVDILIGTHRLIGKDVQFKDLGLLIVDEEQRFGVSVKEKLKQLKVNVDTLTLTATPIPRTLQFSLMGARDLSILNTPPPNRHPIVTELHTFNDEIIKEAILYEVERGGQVFMINNRVQNINEIEAMINRFLPDVKTVVAHGQMEGSKLEKIILDFIAGDYDVLIATTIIESGLDIPNANTIIINNAHQFGLSELHQLRGRVGRSNRKAFCYLIAPPLTALTGDAQKRLKILEEFSDLGSGFNIAMQDLDIRGAGNILGAEQSGYIADIGYETYQRILEEALLELRETEYPELTHQLSSLESKPYVADCKIETDLEIRFPEEYIENIAVRMELYRELDNINNPEKIEEFRRNLIDRFGQLPHQATTLLDVAHIRITAETMGMEKIVFKNRSLKIYFISNPQSPFYQSQLFGNILKWVLNNKQIAGVEEKNHKFSLTVKGMNELSDVRMLLERIMDKAHP